ncbi:MAG: DUF4112 domain-containing protein [Phycisphaerales bacterium JB059]
MVRAPESEHSHAAKLAHLLDDAFEVPGTSWRFGLDPIIGLLPGVGDLAGLLLSLVVLAEARARRVRSGVLLRMLGIVCIDFVVGSIPIVGDAFDFWFKPNLRTLRLLENELQHRNEPGEG